MLKKWLRQKTYDDIKSDESTYILFHKGERQGVVIVEEPSLLHKNMLRLIGVEVKKWRTQ